MRMCVVPINSSRWWIGSSQRVTHGPNGCDKIDCISVCTCMCACVCLCRLARLPEGTTKLAFPYITIHSSSMGASLNFFSLIQKACRLQLGNMTFSKYFILTRICISVFKNGKAKDIFGALSWSNILTDCWHYHLISSVRMGGDPIRSDKTGEGAVPLWPDLKVLVFSVPLWLGMDMDILSAFSPEERLWHWGGRDGRCLQHINDRISQCFWRWFPVGHHRYPQPRSKRHSCWFCSPPQFYFYVFSIEK